MAENSEREGNRQILDDIHLSVSLHGIQQLINNRLDAGAHSLYSAGIKNRDDQRSQSRVIRRIGMDKTLGAVMVFEGFELCPRLGGKILHRFCQASFVGETVN